MYPTHSVDTPTHPSHPQHSSLEGPALLAGGLESPLGLFEVSRTHRAMSGVLEQGKLAFQSWAGYPP